MTNRRKLTFTSKIALETKPNTFQNFSRISGEPVITDGETFIGLLSPEGKEELENERQ